jgi:hypothetical protein
MTCAHPNTSYRLSAIGYQLSAISYQLSAISYQLSAVSYQPFLVLAVSPSCRLAVFLPTHRLTDSRLPVYVTIASFESTERNLAGAQRGAVRMEEAT